MLESEQAALQGPRLYCDRAGRIWLTFRHKVEHATSWSRPWQVESDQMPMMAGYKVYWNTYVTYYDGDIWAPAPNGQLWVLWHTDNRDDSQVQYPRQNQVMSCVRPLT
jgi:hypothetical protein